MSTTTTTTTLTQPAELKVEAISAPAAIEAVQKTNQQPQEAAPTTTNLAALATGGYAFAGIPNITDPYKKRQWQLEHMAGAFRVFARKGYTEGTSGHISVRDPVDPNTFWINP